MEYAHKGEIVALQAWHVKQRGAHAQVNPGEEDVSVSVKRARFAYDN